MLFSRDVDDRMHWAEGHHGWWKEMLSGERLATDIKEANHLIGCMVLIKDVDNRVCWAEGQQGWWLRMLSGEKLS